MTRCNNCMTLFEHNEDIPLLIDKDGKGVKVYDPINDTIEPHDQVYRGCPHCLTDGYLMDME